jgi:hypothetical protein
MITGYEKVEEISRMDEGGRDTIWFCKWDDEREMITGYEKIEGISGMDKRK